jgi:hypothetical protein
MTDDRTCPCCDAPDAGAGCPRCGWRMGDTPALPEPWEERMLTDANRKDAA